MTKSSRFTIKRRLMKSGGSLFVPVPNEVVEMWQMNKGDEVLINVVDGAIRMVPKQATRLENISDEMMATYSQVMRGIEAKITLDTENKALRLEFSGENEEAVKLLLYNLWRNLPALLGMLGVGSVEGKSVDEPKKTDQ